MTVTADQVARELIAAARKAGVDPVRVFEPDMAFVRAKVVKRQPSWAGVLRMPVAYAA